MGSKQLLNVQILERKQNEIKMGELMLAQKNENDQLQRNAVKHSLKAIKVSENMQSLRLELLECRKLQKTHLDKIDSLNEKYKSLTNQHAQIKQEKAALIKEVKKLRKEMIEKEEKKTEILCKMSENESIHRGQIQEYNDEIRALNKQNCDVLSRFKSLICALTDCNSNIESFGDTVNNFSCCALMESYENEYDARCKSTELLNDALHTNINEEIIKLHTKINFDKIKDELNEITSNEKKIKTLFDESKVQIDYIRLAANKLLLEYIESIKECNAMFIKYNPKMSAINEENEDGVYNYVTSMVNSLPWKANNEEQKVEIEMSEDEESK